MSHLAEFLFPAPAPRSAAGIVAWWEGRRLPFNLAVGAAGLTTLAYVSAVLVTVFGEAPQPDLLAVVVAFGVGANVFYTLGWLTEVALHRVFGRELLPVGPALYRMGLTFSVGLALLPSLVITAIAAIHVVVTVLV